MRSIPFTPMERPLRKARLALVTTGGVHLREQPRFDIDDPLGDCSYREIPSGTSRSDLTWTHYYHAPDGERTTELDCILPLWTLRGLAEDGRVGSVNWRHFSFMGAIHDAGPLIDQTAPEVAAKLVEDGVDAVLLAPSCPLCHRSVALISSEIERRQIPTVSLSMQDGTLAPRVARVRFPYNFPAGPPEDPQIRRAVVERALSLLERLESPGEESLPFEWNG